MRSEGSKPNTGLPSSEHQCQKEESPQHLAVKISRDSVWVRWKAAVDLGIRHPLDTDSLTNTHPKLQKRNSSSKSIRGIWVGTKLSGFKARAAGAALSRNKVPANATVSLLNSPTLKQAAGKSEHQI